jgi:hypothetical protein
MAFLSQSFDVSDLPKGATEFNPLPAGWYSATISKADVKPTKAGTGEYINICYSITGPTHQGRTVWGNINIRNPNPKAEEIGRQQLGELMRAIGVGKVSNTDQLIGKDLMIKLTVRDDDKSAEQNEVKGFKAVIGAVSSLPTAAPAAPSSAKAAPPWAKK